MLIAATSVELVDHNANSTTTKSRILSRGRLGGTCPPVQCVKNHGPKVIIGPSTTATAINSAIWQARRCSGPQQRHILLPKRDRHLRPHRRVDHLHHLQRDPRNCPGRTEDHHVGRPKRILYRHQCSLQVHGIAHGKAHKGQRRRQHPLDLRSASPRPAKFDPRNIALDHDAKQKRACHIHRGEHQRGRTRVATEHYRGSSCKAKAHERQCAFDERPVGVAADATVSCLQQRLQLSKQNRHSKIKR